MPVGVAELGLLPQDQVTGLGEDAGLLEDLAVHGRVEVLTWLDVPPDHAPLVGRPRRVLVAVLEQHAASAVDEEGDSDAAHGRPR
jgi:hypothetical protein